jgi:hypothetical protein
MTAKQSATPETVDEYLAAVPDDARDVLQRIRAAIKDAAPTPRRPSATRFPSTSLQASTWSDWGIEGTSLAVRDGL